MFLTVSDGFEFVWFCLYNPSEISEQRESFLRSSLMSAEYSRPANGPTIYIYQVRISLSAPDHSLIHGNKSSDHLCTSNIYMKTLLELHLICWKALLAAGSTVKRSQGAGLLLSVSSLNGVFIVGGGPSGGSNHDSRSAPVTHRHRNRLHNQGEQGGQTVHTSTHL